MKLDFPSKEKALEGEMKAYVHLSALSSDFKTNSFAPNYQAASEIV